MRRHTYLAWQILETHDSTVTDGERGADHIAQFANIAGPVIFKQALERIHFDRGESIWTEASYKYNPPEFAALAAAAGWRVEQVWIDDRGLFSVQYLTPAG